MRQYQQAHSLVSDIRINTPNVLAHSRERRHERIIQLRRIRRGRHAASSLGGGCCDPEMEDDLHPPPPAIATQRRHTPNPRTPGSHPSPSPPPLPSHSGSASACEAANQLERISSRPSKHPRLWPHHPLTPPTMPVKQLETPYPVIDVDPHFSRVVRYMRPNDYLVWGGVTASGPLAIAFWDKLDPSKATHGIRHASRFAGAMGFVAGFFLAYQNSSCKSERRGVERGMERSDMPRSASEERSRSGTGGVDRLVGLWSREDKGPSGRRGGLGRGATGTKLWTENGTWSLENRRRIDRSGRRGRTERAHNCTRRALQGCMSRADAL